MAKPKADELIERIVNQPDNPAIMAGQLIRLECVKVAGEHYRGTADIVRQAAELAYYVETGATGLDKA